jgi:hypothetical protein
MANNSTADPKHHDSNNSSATPTIFKKKKKDKIKPQTRLDLSVNPSDGTLLTAPLSLIINTATDALYHDLHTMTNGVITLTAPSNNATKASAANAAAAASSNDPSAANAAGATNDASALSSARASSLFTTNQESMSNMSFIQRRHVLASTLAKHIQSISHISALVAANLFTSGTASTNSSTSTTTAANTSTSSRSSSIFSSKLSKKQPHLNLYTMSQTPPENELSSIAIATSQALDHIRTSWVNADETQDALYFHHDTLWKVRNHPHDVLGALDVIMKGQWPDMSNDICLKSDGYRDSEEGKWDEVETRERLKSTIRRKMILGEIGMFHSSPSPSSLSLSSSIPQQQENKTNKNQFWWNVVLEQNGTVVRLFHGRPFVVQKNKHEQNLKEENKHGSKTKTATTTKQKIIYPIEARVTVLSENHPAPWTLLSIRIRTNVKTGESNHQLELNPEQMYRFHTLCEAAMNQEENRIKTKLENDNQILMKDKNDNDDKNENSVTINNSTANGNTSTNKQSIEEKIGMSTISGGSIVSRPLEKLLNMSHEFSLSWQLEILSSQADALRKGTWASRMGAGQGGRGGSGGILVSHVHFYSEEEQHSAMKSSGNNSDVTQISPLAVMAIHFWEVDDRNGRPAMGQLTQPGTESEINSLSKSYLPISDKAHTKRLTLEIIAIPRKGLGVSISGGNIVMENLQDSSKSTNSHLQRHVQKLLSSVQDPFQLSASDALLSAAVICAENRCRAVLNVLLKLGNAESQTATEKAATSSSSTRDKMKALKALPSWLHLSVECGSISVGVCISYDGKDDKKRPPVLLFRLACDSRTGCFVPSFPQSASLLRQLICNDPNASEVQLLRQAKAASLQNIALSSNKRRSNTGRSVREKELTGRIVRDAFEGLTRSMDVLGRRVGVGGAWYDVDKSTSSALREKSILQCCGDVRASFMTCSGIAVVYGIGAIATAVASGVNPAPDMYVLVTNYTTLY